MSRGRGSGTGEVEWPEAGEVEAGRAAEVGRGARGGRKENCDRSREERGGEDGAAQKEGLMGDKCQAIESARALPGIPA